MTSSPSNKKPEGQCVIERRIFHKPQLIHSRKFFLSAYYVTRLLIFLVLFVQVFSSSLTQSLVLHSFSYVLLKSDVASSPCNKHPCLLFLTVMFPLQLTSHSNFCLSFNSYSLGLEISVTSSLLTLHTHFVTKSYQFSSHNMNCNCPSFSHGLFEPSKLLTSFLTSNLSLF